MAIRTYRRTPYYSDKTQINKLIKNSDIFNTTIYKGLYDNKNDVSADQSSLADVNNLYYDDNELLSSRPAVKRYVPDKYTSSTLIDESFKVWHVDGYIFRSYIEDSTESSYSYVITCDNLVGITPLAISSAAAYNVANQFDVIFTPMDDVIFIWVTRDDGTKYLYFFNVNTGVFSTIGDRAYVPIKNIITNGISASAESDNMLFSRTRDRYLYAADSSVDFASITGQVVVYLDGVSEQFLYNISMDATKESVLLYPYATISTPTYYDIVEIDTGFVYLCYYASTHNIRISTDGKSFMTISVSGYSLMGNPILYRDGTGFAILCEDKYYTCDVFNMQSTEYYTLTPHNYASTWTPHTTDKRGTGYFLDADNYCFIVHKNGDASAKLFVHTVLGTTTFENWLESYTYNTSHTNYFATDDSISMCHIYNENFSAGPAFVVFSTLTNSAYLIATEQSGSNLVINDESKVLVTNVTLDTKSCIISSSPLYLNTTAQIFFTYGYSSDNSSTVRRGYTNYVLGSFSTSQITWYDAVSMSGNNVSLSGTGRAVTTREYGLSLQPVISHINLPITLVHPIIAGDYIFDIKDGKLYTTYLYSGIRLALDVYHGTTSILLHPSHYTALREYYLSFDKVLGVTSTRRDSSGNFLLYLPKDDSQNFVNTITNLHGISDNNLAVFLEDSVWYVTNSTEVSDTDTVYYRAIKSKLPYGCREGCDVITGTDGQTILFPTPRGIAALGPEDFVATTEPSLSYLSDNIQNFYNKFYGENGIETYVSTVSSVLVNTHREVTPRIHAITYKYWLIYYKEFSKTILLYDMRSGTWWTWNLQYSIRSLYATDRIYALLHVTPVAGEIDEEPAYPFGVLFCLVNNETDIEYNYNRIPSINKSNEILYEDEVALYNYNTLDGTVTTIVDDDAPIGLRTRYEYNIATPTISWHLVSQKLYLSSINNYKCVTGMNIVAKGLYDTRTRLEYKLFRDVQHPEVSMDMTLFIDDLRTFVQRLNLMHLIYFQYRLSNVENDEVLARPIHIESVSIKYELKGAVR